MRRESNKITRLGFPRIKRQRALKSLLGFRRDDAFGLRRERFAEIGFARASRTVVVNRAAQRAHGIIIAAESHIDWSHHFPAAPVLWIACQMRLDLRHQLFDGRRLGSLGARRERLPGKRRRTKNKIETAAQQRQQHQRGNRDGALGSGPRCHRLGRVMLGRGKQASRYLDPRGFRLRFADPSGSMVTADFVKLVAIDPHVVPG